MLCAQNYLSASFKEKTFLPILQAVFSKKRFQTPLKPFTSGYKLEDYIIGNQIGKGSNAAVYEAAARFAPPKESNRKCSLVQLREDEEEGETSRSLTCCSSLRNFPLAVKMMWNFGVYIFSNKILIIYRKTDDSHSSILTDIFNASFVCRRDHQARPY